ncbi:MAG TPA: trehalose-phosphatase [Aestuariivirgaceae bacterium]|nr:trehalose-phosphatase [Aestuariivirgaceae bacterium]
MTNGPIPLDLARFDAGVFDLDGVVTDTATLHRVAWKDMFDAFLGEARAPFTDDDYYRFVDGRPRYEGVRTFLESRKLDLPYGDPDDAPERDTICGLGNRKNEAFNGRLRDDGVETFHNSVRLIHMIKAHGLKTALVTSSRNAQAVLAAAGIEPLFDAVVDGNEAIRQNLRGKPHPDTYRHALEVLGVDPARAFGVEDATSGVESIRAAGYGLVVGVDRAGQRQSLLDHGADIVVRDLGELRLAGSDAEPDLPDALARFDDLARLFAERKPAIFLDYDGTLTPIVSRPELAVLDEPMRATLADLAETFPAAIISGRDRANVEDLVGLRGMVYAGSHGFDIAGPGGLKREYEGAAKFVPALDEAEKLLNERLGGIEGVIVERKRYAIAVHYRLVADARVPAVEEAFDAVLGEVGTLRRTAGKKVVEMRPQLAWHTGKAVLWLLEELGLDRPDVLPVYIGDDETDEDAFAALAGRGLGILVADGPQETHAEYRLESPEAVGEFLRRLIASFN